VRCAVTIKYEVFIINNSETIGKVHNSMYQQLQKTGVATPVQVLIDVGVLSASDYGRWRNGGVDYLERVCKVNLHKLAFIMKQVRGYARKNDLKPSWTFYKQWGNKGKKPSVKLRFSKSGNEDIERSYAMHYISQRLRAEQKPLPNASKNTED